MITPATLTLVSVDEQQLAAIMQSVPGGADNVEDLYPLSPLQEGMLFHYLLNENTDPYMLSIAFELQSHEQVQLLAGAVQRVIDRHAVLRSAILWEGLPRPLQVVYRHAPLPVSYQTLDATCDSVDQIKQQLETGHIRMDLGKAPLLQFQAAADPHGAQWYAILHIHHITCDHQSLNIIIEEVMAHVAGQEQGLSAPVPFRRYVEHSIASFVKHDAEAYFRSRLAQCDEPTAPFGQLDVQGAGREVRQARRVLDPALAQRIIAQARQMGVGSGRLFHAAWAVVVAHTSQREDVVFGTVLLARERRSLRTQRMVGLSINTLPLRLQLDGATCRELVEQAYREMKELLKHEAAPLTLAQRCSGVADTVPLFTSILNYRHSQHGPEPEVATKAGVRLLARGSAGTNYPVSLSVDDLGDGFVLTAQTDSRIDPDRVAGYLDAALRSLVSALESAPDTPALMLSILPEAERHSVVESFNATQVEYPKRQVIHGLFEEQVARTPDVTAVLYEQQALTYSQLDRSANQLACHLRSKGGGPDQLVGICVERGLDMVIGLLGVLKAGSAYLPLDPHYPVERLRYMLEDAAPRVLLTQRSLAGLLPAPRMEVIVMDAQLEATIAEDLSNIPASSMEAEKLLYVIYTSGSTGHPKGTAMTHGAMVNLIEWHRQTLPVEPGTRVSQFAALSFDVAFQEVFSTLCLGGTLVLLDETVRRDARALLEFLDRHRVQRMFLPPMMLQHLAECWRVIGVAPEELTEIITAGEALRISPEIVAFCKHLAGCRLHNHYGPTETHVVTALTLEGDPEAWPALPDIGTPIANTQIYILDRRKQPVPIGVAGEIHIGGANVARGYLNRPELTAARFLQDPFSMDPKARIYATGDLGRWRPDGGVEYLGRNDDQVKIRGFRIEPKEIEAQLRSHPRVIDAVVIAVQNASTDKCLAAYVTTDREGRPSKDDLHKHLQGLVPDHMVPSVFVLLDELPLTPSGKLNRRALPVPQFGADESRDYDPPRGKVEEELAEIWRRLLGVGQVNRADNFFKLGGDSMASLRLAVRIVERFAIRFTVAAIFQYATLQRMAEAIETLGRGGQERFEADRMEFDEGVV